MAVRLFWSDFEVSPQGGPFEGSLHRAFGQRCEMTLGYLTTLTTGLKYRQFRVLFTSRPARAGKHPGFMNSIPPQQVPEKRSNMQACKHPRVQIVSREEDAEFVECLECGDIFESSEFKDMNIEETKLDDEA
jgi:hypothetical protein